MITRTNSDYTSTRAWLRDIIHGEQYILRGVSALEFLQMFGGYVGEKQIEVYATQQGNYDNVDYKIVNGFSELEYIKIGDTLCTTFNQTVNDMLLDFDSTDELALTEALSNYYYENNESFSGLIIKPENRSIFNYVLKNAIEYANGG